MQTRLRQIELRHWFFIWATIFLFICVFGLVTPNSLLLSLLKLSGIFLCSVYVYQMHPHDHLLLFAMLATFVADIFLAIDNSSLIGIMIFLIVQIAHLVRLDGERLSRFIIFYSIGCLLLILMNQIVPTVPNIVLIAGLYIIVLLTNILVCNYWYREQPLSLPARCACAGFILFLCCDLCTGISYLSITAALPAFLYIPANFFAWFFYYPSQILVANSTKCVIMSAKEGKS